jgi:hypothetical protein
MTRAKWVVAAGSMLFAGFLAASAYLFVWPRTSRPAGADAVVILGPGLHGERFDKGMSLTNQGLGRALVISKPRNGREPVPGICAGRWRLEVICFRARPFTTRGEARQLGRIAVERGWKSLIVVTSTYHVTRARILLERCYPGHIEMVAANPGASMVETMERIAHEWAGLLYGITLEREC